MSRKPTSKTGNKGVHQKEGQFRVGLILQAPPIFLPFRSWFTSLVEKNLFDEQSRKPVKTQPLWWDRRRGGERGERKKVSAARQARGGREWRLVLQGRQSAQACPWDLRVLEGGGQYMQWSVSGLVLSVCVCVCARVFTGFIGNEKGTEMPVDPLDGSQQRIHPFYILGQAWPIADLAFQCLEVTGPWGLWALVSTQVVCSQGWVQFKFNFNSVSFLGWLSQNRKIQKPFAIFFYQKTGVTPIFFCFPTIHWEKFAEEKKGSDPDFITSEKQKNCGNYS